MSSNASDVWYYAANGQQVGPVTSSVLRQMLAAGHLTLDDQVWREGFPDWQAISTLPEFASPVPPVPQGYEVPAGASQPQYPTANVLEYQQPYQPQVSYDPTSHYSNKFIRNRYSDAANTAMVLSIIGIFCFRIVLGPVSLVMGIWSLVGLCRLGIQKGRGMAIAAIAIGGLSTVLVILAFAAIAVM